MSRFSNETLSKILSYLEGERVELPNKSMYISCPWFAAEEVTGVRFDHNWETCKIPNTPEEVLRILK